MAAPVGYPRSVLIVDDQAAARAWLSRAVGLVSADAKVHVAQLVREAIQILNDNSIDLALVDLGLPDASGLEILRWLRQRQPQAICVVASVFDDDEHLFAALRLGAQGYLLKDQAQDTLAESLHAVLAGQPALSPGIARRVLLHFSSGEPPPVPEAPKQLTSRERDVLQLVGKGCTVPETARMLGISAHTAHGYVKDLYRKLAVSSRAEAAVAASRLGLV